MFANKHARADTYVHAVHRRTYTNMRIYKLSTVSRIEHSKSNSNKSTMIVKRQSNVAETHVNDDGCRYAHSHTNMYEVRE